MSGDEAALINIDHVVSGMIALFHPHLEAVLHDVTLNRIARIWNPYSGRSVGGESLLDAETVAAMRPGEVMGPYEQVAVDGRPVTSVSVPLLDARYLLCVNLDRSAITDAVSALRRFATAIEPQPAPLFEKDWQSGINQVVDEWCRNRQRRRDRLTRADRESVVSLLDDKGLFATRYAAAHVSRTLGVSRATVYSLLKEARASSPESKSGPQDIVED